MNQTAHGATPGANIPSPSADTLWIRAYERIWPTDPISDDDPRRLVIAQEMRELRKAKSLEDGLKVIGWWYGHGGLDEAVRDAEIRGAMRRLKANKALKEIALGQDGTTSGDLR